MTWRQAIFLVASEEIARAKDWEWAVYCNPKQSRSALKKARLEVHAAEMRAARILSAKPRHLPETLRHMVEKKIRDSISA